MSTRLTVRLTTALRARLDDASRRTGRTASGIVRAALARYLGAGVDERRPADRVSHLLGSLESGAPGLAIRHRCYVLRSLRGRR